MALVRFVNTLIDPLQNAYYAKSMAMLASQLGLPLWFIELRHAATHEDLPSLEVLQDAARQALDYLHSTYWLPALSSKPPPIDTDALQQLLKTYKELTKVMTRDHSRIKDVQPQIDRTLRDVDGWVATHSISHGSDSSIDALSDLLGEEGYLVPLAKAKRASMRQPGLPSALQALWMPLLDHVDSSNDGFFEALVFKLTSRLTDGPGLFSMPDLSANLPSEQDKKSDDYFVTLAAWIHKLVGEMDDDKVLYDVVKMALLAATPQSLKLVTRLIEGHEKLEKQVNPLLQALRSNDLTPEPTDPAEISKHLDEMEAKVAELEQQMQAQKASASTATSNASDSTGWSRVQDWSPRPIGSLPKSGLEQAQSLYLPPRPIRV